MRRIRSARLLLGVVAAVTALAILAFIGDPHSPVTRALMAGTGAAWFALVASAAGAAGHWLISRF
ncbi:MAG: hypothetical protein Q8P46_06880 [Hyphomicrobiales bacterium]|nr:hypothetical protein [Hyphomicrobiales bacterium]